MYTGVFEKAMKKKEREDEIARAKAAKKARTNDQASSLKNVAYKRTKKKKIPKYLTKEQALQLAEECGFGDEEKKKLTLAAKTVSHE